MTALCRRLLRHCPVAAGPGRTPLGIFEQVLCLWARRATLTRQTTLPVYQQYPTSFRLRHGCWGWAHRKRPASLSSVVFRGVPLGRHALRYRGLCHAVCRVACQRGDASNPSAHRVRFRCQVITAALGTARRSRSTRDTADRRRPVVCFRRRRFERRVRDRTLPNSADSTFTCGTTHDYRGLAAVLAATALKQLPVVVWLTPHLLAW